MDQLPFETSDVVRTRSVYRGFHFGNINVMADDLEFYGLVHGTVTVASGRQLFLRGRISGNLVIKQDAIAAIHGSIMGSVLNHGAKVMVSGRAGRVRSIGNARTYINHALIPAKNLVPDRGLKAGITPAASRRRLAGRDVEAVIDRVLGSDGAPRKARAGWTSWVLPD